ncbi:MAG TPA: putative quinol monooxygenase [Candidatus Binatia bacterium]|nr:putative quinol monooxygenase [Candidatus Binatia bacterium]
MLCLAVVYTFPAERVAEVRKTLALIARESEKEPGCKMFIAHQAQDDPRRFFLYEQYDDQAAFEAHQQTAHFKEHVLGKVRPWAQDRLAVMGPPIAES